MFGRTATRRIKAAMCHSDASLSASRMITQGRAAGSALCCRTHTGSDHSPEVIKTGDCRDSTVPTVPKIG